MTLFSISVIFPMWAPIAELTLNSWESQTSHQLTVLTWSLMIVLLCRHSELK